MKITAQFVRELVAAQFPQWSELDLRPVEANGWDNTTFRMGEDMSVRLPNSDRYAVQVDKEQRWLPQLAPRLPLPIPSPLARGEPTDRFPLPWSVYRWIDGAPMNDDPDIDDGAVAHDLGRFLSALYAVELDGGPRPDLRNRRGGPLRWLDEWARSAIAACGSRIDGRRVADAWEMAVDTAPYDRAVWLHGDVAPTNLLVQDGRLSGVIDFGCLAVGDPACDLMIAWTVFDSQSRRVFREALNVDEGIWARGRGWAIWKAVLVLQDEIKNQGTQPTWSAMGWTRNATGVLDELLAEA